ncbi:MAG: extradiol dioxygenase [Nocardioides sp.]|nr:extradiol dioxygenase [Nocardioides sp.]
MITAVHAMVMADDPEAARAFLKDVVGLPHVDAGGGWLIFKSGPSEIGVHPSAEGGPFDVSLMCDDLDATMADLASRGAEFGPVEKARWGRLARMSVPGGQPITVYQPTYDPPATSL